MKRKQSNYNSSVRDTFRVYPEYEQRGTTIYYIIEGKIMKPTHNKNLEW